MAKDKEAPIRFRGSPRNIEGLAYLTPQQTLAASLWIDLDLPETERQGLALQTETLSASVAKLRFSLPESVPPGVYQGKVQIEAESRPITVEVDPHPFLTISPSQLSLQVTPDSQVPVVLTLLNTGNVPCEITKVYAFGIFDVTGADRAIGAAIVGGSEEKGRGRLDRFMDEAANNHGGLVLVSLEAGDGRLEPGELRDIKATLRFSNLLKPGRNYWGTWPMINLRYYVRVNVLGSPPVEDDKNRRRKE
jgi:hypothetical protein